MAYPCEFNQIRRARDKNKPNINPGQLDHFRETLQACELKEIHLQKHHFTWSNERVNPTLCKIDPFYCKSEWDNGFDTHVLHPLSSSLSDHYPYFLPMIVDQEGQDSLSSIIFSFAFLG
jgi:hypothetical protein